MDERKIVRCPLCADTRSISGRAFRKGNRDLSNYPCKKHAWAATRCQRFFQKPLYESYYEDEKAFIEGALWKYDVRTAAVHLSLSESGFRNLLRIHKIGAKNGINQAGHRDEARPQDAPG